MCGYKLDNRKKELKSHRMLTSVSFICLSLAFQTLVLYRKLFLAKKILKIIESLLRKLISKR